MRPDHGSCGASPAPVWPFPITTGVRQTKEEEKSMDLEDIKQAADKGSPEAHEKLSDYYLFEYPPNRQLAMHHIEMVLTPVMF